MKSFFRRALIAATTLASVTFSFAQVDSNPAAPGTVPASNGVGPRIQFNTEDYDFGKVISGEPVKFTYFVTNTGDETLEIRDVHPGCGCTTAGEFTRHIAPNQSGVIPIQLSTTGQHGPLQKVVTITSNDRLRGNLTVHLHGTAWTPIEVTPQAAAYFTLAPGTTTNTTSLLHITSHLETPVSFLPPESTTNYFTAELKTNVPGKEYDLIITAGPSSRLPVAQGSTLVQGNITLKPTGGTTQPVSITVFATVQPEVMVGPVQLMLPGGPLAQASTNWVTVRGNTDKILMLADAKVNYPEATAEIRTLQTNHAYNLKVVFPQGMEIKPGDNIMVSVKTDNPNYPEIKVPVFPIAGTLRSTAIPPPSQLIVPALSHPRLPPPAPTNR